MRRLMISMVVALMWCPAALAQGNGNGESGAAQPAQPAAADESVVAQAGELKNEQDRLRAAISGWAERFRDGEGNVNPDDPAVRAYQGIEAALKSVDEKLADAAKSEQSRLEAPARMQTIQGELALPPAEVKPEVAGDATLAQLEQRLAEVRAQLDTARQQVADLAAEKSSRDAAMDAIPKSLSDLRQRVSALDEDFAAAGGESGGADDEAARAQRMLTQAERLAARAEIYRLERQRASIEARRELLPARQSLAARRVTEAEKLVGGWDAVVNARRQAEAEDARRQAEELRRKAARQHPVLNSYAEQNAELAKELNALQTPINGQTATQRETAITNRAKEIRNKKNALETRVKKSGLDDATGLALRRVYATIGDVDDVERESESVSERRQQIEYRLQEIAGELDDVRDDTNATAALMERVESDETAIENRDDVAAVARELVAARKDLLDKLDKQLTTRGSELDALQSAYKDPGIGLIPTLRDAIAFIEQRILWVRSVSGPAVPSIDEASDALGWLASPSAWGASIRSSWEATRLDRARSVSIAAALALLLLVRLRAPARLGMLNERVRSFRTDRFGLTIRALIVTALMSLPVPALLLALAWFLERPGGAGELALSAASGLRAASGVMFVLILARNILRDDGLGENHFAWHTSGVRTIRWHLRWFVPTISVLWGAAIALDVQSVNDAYSDSLGRICFIGAMVSLSVFLARVLKPTGAVLGPIVSRHAGQWLDRLRVVWYSAGVGVPIVLIGLALAKYYYTALRLQHLLFATIWLIGALVLISALTGRWLYIVRRRLAIESAKRKREQARAAAVAEAEKNATGASATSPASPPPPPTVDPNEVNIPALDSKMRQAVRTGIGLAFLIGMMLIWSEVLPALKMLDRVQLWPRVAYSPEVSDGAQRDTTSGDRTASANGENEDKSGGVTAPAPGMKPLSASAESSKAGAAEPFRLTLGNVGLALLFGVITVLVVRNVPAVVELMLLEHLPLDSASRYALVSVFRYGLALVGVTLTMGAMGITWSTVQWLAAALTFGLAFGLQEIFANFVSGLIILAERPIRVGDMVTVGDMDGTVTKIRMRATTVLGWDRKEIIIPNKTFITDRVVNWTLSDSVQRIVATVGVAYGSNLELVERTLLEACQAVPGVLSDPPVSVLFRGFGDSTLNWEARVHVAGVDQLVVGRSVLHQQIDAMFRREGIEIAFPQLDLHVRSSEGLSEFLRSGAGGRAVSREGSARMTKGDTGGTAGPEGA